MATATPARVRSVLVVDDEKNIRSTLTDILEEEGFEVLTADTGEKAVRLCHKRAFDAVLLDVRMPGMDGFEAFRLMRRHRRDVRVVMMSAYSTNEFRRIATEQGAMAFLRKPLDVDRVIELMQGLTRDRDPRSSGPEDEGGRP